MTVIQPSIEKILTQYTCERENLVLVLQEIQEKAGFVSKEMMEEVADFFNIHPCEVYSIVTFYKKFRRNPPGIYPITVCLGTACYLSGGELVLSALERELDIKLGETTADGLFSLEKAACFGCCNFAPVIRIKEKIFPRVTASKVEEIIVLFRG